MFTPKVTRRQDVQTTNEDIRCFEEKSFVSGSYCSVVNMPVAGILPKPVLRTLIVAAPNTSRSDMSSPRRLMSSRCDGLASRLVLWQRTSPALDNTATSDVGNGDIQFPSPPSTVISRDTSRLETRGATEKSRRKTVMRPNRSRDEEYSSGKLPKDKTSEGFNAPSSEGFPRRSVNSVGKMRKQQRAKSCRETREKSKENRSQITYTPKLRIRRTQTSGLAFPINEVFSHGCTSIPRTQRRPQRPTTVSFYKGFVDYGSRKALNVQTLRPFNRDLELTAEFKKRQTQNRERMGVYLAQQQLLNQNNMNAHVCSPRDDNFIASIRKAYRRSNDVGNIPRGGVVSTPRGGVVSTPRGGVVSTPRCGVGSTQRGGVECAPRNQEETLFEADEFLQNELDDDKNIHVEDILNYYSRTNIAKLKKVHIESENPKELWEYTRNTPSPQARSNTPNFPQTPVHSRHASGNDCFNESIIQPTTTLLLGDKTFYLKTPSMAELPPGIEEVCGKEMFDCNCELCKLELLMVKDTGRGFRADGTH